MAIYKVQHEFLSHLTVRGLQDGSGTRQEMKLRLEPCEMRDLRQISGVNACRLWEENIFNNTIRNILGFKALIRCLEQRLTLDWLPDEAFPVAGLTVQGISESPLQEVSHFLRFFRSTRELTMAVTVDKSDWIRHIPLERLGQMRIMI